MYQERYYPFYMNFGDPAIWEEERLMERENQLMKSFYPEIARRIQNEVEAECDRQDYPGSIIYDEYPDRLMTNQMCRRVRNNLETQENVTMQEYRDNHLVDELISVLLFQEMRRRRCRKHRCRRYF